MRTLIQPGPPAAQRIDMATGEPEFLSFVLRAGLTLHDALTGPMAAAGFQGGTIEIEAGALNPFRYVMPGPPDNASHVAYFTAPRAPTGETRLERANATFGWAEGQPFLHCHAVWIESDGARRGGHILPRETVVARETQVRAWGFRTVRIETALERETNFTLFGVAGTMSPNPQAVVGRIKPNQDITLAVEEIARANAMPNAAIRGSLGSLIGAQFTSEAVNDLATEVLVRRGCVRDGHAELDLIAVDMMGEVHEGRPIRGENPVLITFDIVLDRTPAE
jgi:predicted DNA-binding protein with PD1-like motif